MTHASKMNGNIRNYSDISYCTKQNMVAIATIVWPYVTCQLFFWLLLACRIGLAGTGGKRREVQSNNFGGVSGKIQF